MRTNQRDVQRRRVYACPSPAFTNLIQKGREERGNTAADHNDVGFQEIDDVPRQYTNRSSVSRITSVATGSPSAWASHYLAADLLKVASRHFQQDRSSDSARVSGAPSGDRGACHQRFDAAMFSAIADRTVPIDPDMSAFRRLSSLTNAIV
jgi:hypothetical protein